MERLGRSVSADAMVEVQQYLAEGNIGRTQDHFATLNEPCLKISICYPCKHSQTFATQWNIAFRLHCARLELGMKIGLIDQESLRIEQEHAQNANQCSIRQEVLNLVHMTQYLKRDKPGV